MPIQTSMEAAHISWRPLGELLVEHGVLTETELENALAEQQRSGRKLGEIIVEHGFASGPAVTRALAEQWGLELSPERGFGSGLWGEIERRHREKREHQSEARPPLEHKLIEFPSVLRTLDPGNGGRESAGDVPDDLRGQLEDSETRAEEQTQRVAGLEEALSEARSELGRLRARLAERDREVAALSAAAAAGGETEAPVAKAPAAHLLFVPDSSRYIVLEREGGPPTVGALVELEHAEEEDGGTFVVAKVSRSPFPGDRRPCAYLEVAALLEQPDD